MDTLMEDPVQLPCKHAVHYSILDWRQHIHMHGRNGQVALSLTV